MNPGLALYSGVMSLASGLIRVVAPFIGNRSKTVQFIAGQTSAMKHAQGYAANADGRPLVWIHCSSLGEYAIARPVIDLIKDRCRVALTFFSPTGVEHFKQPPSGVDFLGYLPLDTRANAREFAAALKPACAVFMVSEYWACYLTELKALGVPTLLVSAKINGDEPFFKPWGGFYRKAIEAYSRVYAIDGESVGRLSAIGLKCAQTLGNPLFDNAYAKSQQPWSDPLIERFTGGKRVFVAGSIHDSRDRELVCALAKSFPKEKMIFVPHAIGRDDVEGLAKELGDAAAVYSACADSAGLEEKQVLIIDFVGALALIYRYGFCAYIGGGFTPYLHSLVEAVAYGLPVAFGPRIERKITPSQLIAEGLGTIVRTPEDLCQWFGRMLAQGREPDEKAKSYVERNLGASAVIANEILSYCEKSR